MHVPAGGDSRLPGWAHLLPWSTPATHQFPAPTTSSETLRCDTALKVRGSGGVVQTRPRAPGSVSSAAAHDQARSGGRARQGPPQGSLTRQYAAGTGVPGPILVRPASGMPSWNTDGCATADATSQRLVLAHRKRHWPPVRAARRPHHPHPATHIGPVITNYTPGPPRTSHRRQCTSLRCQAGSKPRPPWPRTRRICSPLRPGRDPSRERLSSPPQLPATTQAILSKACSCPGKMRGPGTAQPRRLRKDQSFQ